MYRIRLYVYNFGDSRISGQGYINSQQEFGRWMERKNAIYERGKGVGIFTFELDTPQAAKDVAKWIRTNLRTMAITSMNKSIIYAGIDKFDNVTQKYTRRGGCRGYIAGNRQMKLEWEDI
jgi:hypothetical protein